MHKLATSIMLFLEMLFFIFYFIWNWRLRKLKSWNQCISFFKVMTVVSSGDSHMEFNKTKLKKKMINLTQWTGNEDQVGRGRTIVEIKMLWQLSKYLVKNISGLISCQQK